MTDKPKRVRGPRKTSPRNGKGTGKNKVASETLRWKWKHDPVFIEKMRQRDINRSRMMREHPEKFFRRGVPDGMRKADAAPLWERANQLADRFIQLMKDNGQLDDEQVIVTDDDGKETLVSVPSSDTGKAEVALREAFVLAVGPSTQVIKVQAIRTVLEYTKAKPETKSKLTLNKAEEFLAAVAEDMKPNDGA